MVCRKFGVVKTMLNADYVSVDTFVNPVPFEIEADGKEAHQCSNEIGVGGGFQTRRESGATWSFGNAKGRFDLRRFPN